MPVLQGGYLKQLASAIFHAAGVNLQKAQAVADSLVEADLAGHESHGVIRVKEYLKDLAAGRIQAAAEPRVLRETATTLVVDGGWGFGSTTATWTMQQLIAKAQEQNLAAGGLFRCGHIGRIGVYPALAAEHGMVAFAFVNGGGAEPRVAPFGGSRPVFGTNPLAAAIPVADSAPVVVDFSTAVVASGKIRVARDRGEQLPQGWILDRQGRPSVRPADYYDGGMLLTAAGHKGYGLSLLIEALGGLLTGAGSLLVPESGYQVGNGVFFLALRIDAFRPLDEFTAQMKTMGEAIHGTPPILPGEQVMLPGEPESRTRARRLLDGVPVADETWKGLQDAAKSLGVPIGA